MPTQMSIESLLNINKINIANLVTKSNKLIEASYKLTLNEQRLILILASLVQPEDTEFKKYVLKVSDIMSLLELKNKRIYNDLQEITKGLISKVFTIKQDDQILQMSWLASARYHKRLGIIELQFAPDLKPYLLQLKQKFTSYKLENVLKLKSFYYIRLYEILKQYQWLSHPVTIDIARLRELLGIEEDEYPTYANIKQRILIPAQKELQEKTDLGFMFKEIKKGRKVVALEFDIRFVFANVHPEEQDTV